MSNQLTTGFAFILVLAAAALAQQHGRGGSAAAATFEQAFADYKTAVKEFEALRGEFQTAGPERREAINAELDTYYHSLKQKVDAMVSTALEEYKQAPNSDDEVTKFLLSVAEHDIRGVGPNRQGGDQYERALKVVDALVEGGQAQEQKTLPILGLIAAYVTGQLDQAERFKQLAAEVGSFDEPPPENDEVGSQVFNTALNYAQSIAGERELWEAEQKVRAAEAEADDLPRVRLTTSKGEIVIELFENEAPNTVANFITLVKDGFYDGIFFHRVLPAFMAHGGDPEGTGGGGPGYNIRCECYEPDARKHFRGSLSMAKRQPRDTGGSQFFLTFVPTHFLDGKHTVFGRVIEGMDVLAEIQRVEPGDNSVVRDKIVKAEVIRDRGHEYQVEKI